MAKVKGPLMSMEASGSYGSTLVFGRRLGSNVVRQLVKPSNPQTQGQMDARNRVWVFGALQKFVSGTALMLDGQTKTDKELIAALTPAGQRWNSRFHPIFPGLFRTGFVLILSPAVNGQTDDAPLGLHSDRQLTIGTPGLASHPLHPLITSTAPQPNGHLTGAPGGAGDGWTWVAKQSPD